MPIQTARSIIETGDRPRRWAKRGTCVIFRSAHEGARIHHYLQFDRRWSGEDVSPPAAGRAIDLAKKDVVRRRQTFELAPDGIVAASGRRGMYG